MGVKLRASPRFRVPADAGDPGVGWKVHTYEAGTTTNKPTYTDNAKTATNTNPVLLNARGEADIWWDGVYKVVIKDADDVTKYTVDNYGAGEEASTASLSSGNLAINGSFEVDSNADNEPDDWSITTYSGGTVAIDTAQQVHGANSLKFTSTGTGGGIAESTFFEVLFSGQIKLSYWYYSSVVDVRNLVEISWYTNAQVIISTTTLVDESAANPTSWTKQNHYATAPATAKYAKFRFYGCHTSDPTSGSTWLDDVFIDRLPILDEDDMVSDDAYSVPSQQSTKAYTASRQKFVTSATGVAEISSIDFDVDSSVVESTWESVGPTGSGADNIWTALDGIPSDIDWIVVRIVMLATSTGDTANIWRTVDISARKDGSTASDTSAKIFRTSGHVTSAGSLQLDDNVEAHIPVASGIFDIFWVSSLNGSILIALSLVGYGYN